MLHVCICAEGRSPAECVAVPVKARGQCGPEYGRYMTDGQERCEMEGCCYTTSDQGPWCFT